MTASALSARTRFPDENTLHRRTDSLPSVVAPFDPKFRLPRRPPDARRRVPSNWVAVEISIAVHRRLAADRCARNGFEVRNLRPELVAPLVVMHDSFFGFYPPNQQEYDRLWKEGLIVFDTNALLDLYRLPLTAREELFKALEYFQDRVWIPYQVGLEFQRNRFSVILEQKKLTAAALTEAEKLIVGLKGRINALKLDQHGIGFDPEPSLEKLNAPISNISEAIKKVQAAELDVSASDPIRERLDKIFEKRVGVGPVTQEELDELSKDSDARFASKIPPGYADEKQKDGRTFIHDQLTYRNALGDLILWRQLLTHVKTNKIKCVMMITGDQKEDWWWKEGHKVIGPHQELMREIKRVAEVEAFWMYTSDHFLQLSPNYTNQPVSKEAVAELTNLVQRTDVERSWMFAKSYAGHSDFLRERQNKKLLQLNFHRANRVHQAVGMWLARNRTGLFSLSNNGFVKFVGEKDARKIGYSVIEAYSVIKNAAIARDLATNIEEKRAEITERGLDRLGLIVVTDVDDLLNSEENLPKIREEAAIIAAVFELEEIIFGAVENDEFSTLFIIPDTASS